VQDDDGVTQAAGGGGPARDAAHWLAALELGTADYDAFERWRGADPRHALAFARAYAHAEAVSKLAAPDQMVTPAPLSRRRLLRGAAAGLVVLGSGSVFFGSRAMAWTHARTAIGEFQKVALPDGSHVVLNTDTEVAWRFERDRRHIRLKRGEVALDLLPGAPARFTVADSVAALTPGRFVVRMRPRDVDLLVLRGKALVDGRTAVGARELASLTSAAPRVQSTSDERISRATAWQSGEIEFDDTRLADAVDEYNRYLARRIVIDAAPLQDLRVGGRFATADPDVFLKALTLGFDVQVSQRDGAFHLSQKI